MLYSGSVVVVADDRAGIVDTQRLGGCGSGKIDCLESRGSSDKSVRPAGAFYVKPDDFPCAIYVDGVGAGRTGEPDSSEYAVTEDKARVVAGNIGTRTN